MTTLLQLGVYLENRVFSTWRKVRAEGTFVNDSNFASWLLGLELRRRREHNSEYQLFHIFRPVFVIIMERNVLKIS